MAFIACFMTADIDLADTIFGSAIISPDWGTPFTGIFDGGGHVVTNMYIDSFSVKYVGLFGVSSGIIKNLQVASCVVTNAGNNAGGICGYNTGIIKNSCSTGKLSGEWYVGCLCGYNKGAISDCYSTGSASGRQYVGGFCADNRGTISDSYSTGSVSGNNSYGGFCGRYTEGIISGCFWDIETSNKTTSFGGTGINTEAMQRRSIFIDAGWDFSGERVNGTNDIWSMSGYPVFRRQVDSDNDGINDTWELAKFGTLEQTANADNDIDGFSNIEKYIAGTDPTLASSRFMVNSLNRTQNGFVVSWTAAEGRFYDVYWTSSLSREFILLESGIAYPVDSYLDISYSKKPSGYYMVKVRLPGGEDSDGDGLPDIWEREFFSNSASAVAGYDADGDGYSNVQEYFAGTNPTNSASYFGISLDMSQMFTPGGRMIIWWDVVESRYYNVLWAPSLSESFISLESGIGYPSNCYTDRVHSVDQKGFYREWMCI